MAFVDFILNLAGLLLWLNWRTIRFDPLTRRVPATLMGTLRPAAPQRLERWHFLVLIGLLLSLRSLVYNYVGARSNWSPHLDFGPVVLPFHCGTQWSHYGNLLAYSFASFGLTMGIFYACLLPLSLLAGPDPTHRLVKIPLGRVDEWPRWLRAALPLAVTAIGWWCASWIFSSLEIIPKPISPAERLEQSLVIGLGSYLLWKFPLGAILLIHLVNSYIYFGRHPFLKYVEVTAQKLMHPLKRLPLRIGRVDLSPLLAITLLFLAAEGIGYGLYRIYLKLPF